MSTVADYIGRTYDVAAFRGVHERGEALLVEALADEASSGEICTGVQKVAQWFVIELLTRKGSRPYRPDEGTELLDGLLSGRLRTETDVFVAFGFAVGDIQALATRVEAADAPDDERFAGAVLDQVDVQPGLVRLHTSVTTAAGPSREVILPIPTIV